MSGNHNQSLDMALELVDIAAKPRGDSVKPQTYTTDTIMLISDSGEFQIKNDDFYGITLICISFINRHMPWEWRKSIFGRVKQHGIIAFSSSFDESAVDFVTDLDVPCFNINYFI